MHRSSDEKLVQAFRHCGPYLKHHRGSTFVIMIPGATVESSHLDDIIGDIALLQSLDMVLKLTLTVLSTVLFMLLKAFLMHKIIGGGLMMNQ